VSADTPGTQSWAEAQALRRTSWPREPRNTFSNLAYLGGAVAVLARGQDLTRVVMAGALIVLAVGSAYYHSVETQRADNWDWAGMVLCLTVLAVHALWPHAPGLALGAAMVALVLTLIYAPSWDLHYDALLGVLFAAALLPTLVHGRLGLILAGVACFALGYAAWWLDRTRVLGLYGHALWHVLTGAGFPLL